MRLSDFDFELPEACIALRPAQPRDAAKLLVVRPGAPFEDRIVCELPDLLAPGDVLVFNNTRVIPARLSGVRDRGGLQVSVEATLLRRLAADRWSALMRPGKRLKMGDRVDFSPGRREADGAGGDLADQGEPVRAVPAGGEITPIPTLPPSRGKGLGASIVAKGEAGEVTLAFDRSGAELDAAIAEHGAMPLPPYIAAKRGEDDQDRLDYQTMFARHDGSVAAPTAGLHFTPELLAGLQARGVGHVFVTLHVGAGTFLPVKVDEVADHRMHPEFGEVSAETAAALNAARAAGGRIVPVGTTSLRLLESAADARGVIHSFADETAIFITPGHQFRAADALVTNFHLPRSTLFMLVSAFAGTEVMKAAYAHAISTGYRFYSYGDASLLFPGKSAS